ncbi:MAG TPA: methyltransferase domain-containing protein [Patescibacteria group bacterium]|jgi:SAM-dependent methyltransferase|nr:methyltransferase domain-containing protein [Patescibacteria group bacterium]
MRKQLDLGVGGADRIRKGYKGTEDYEGYGVDIVGTERPWLKENKAADLAIEDIPYESDMFDLVTAYDFLEHIPSVLYVKELALVGNVPKLVLMKRNCMIELFNEIYRVLKHDGEFYMQTPSYLPNWNNEAVWSDPTHCFVWTPATVNHFSGDYVGQHDDYGHTSKFKRVDQRFENGHIFLTLRAVKPAEPPYELS